MQRFSTLGRRDLNDNQAICTAGVSLCQHHDVKLRYSVAVDFVLGYDTPCTSSLLATAAVFSARNAPVILMLPSMGEHWCAVAGLDQLIGKRRYVHPRDRTTSGGFASRGTCRARCHAFSRNWMNLCYSPNTGRWAGE
jgi:hypothetical protein